MADAPTENPARRQVDVISVMMLLLTVAAIVGVVWLRYGPSSSSDQVQLQGSGELAMNAEAPPLHLLDLKTSEPLVLMGMNDRVVWVVFWSAAAPSGGECLMDLERVWERLKAHRRFALLAAAVEVSNPASVRGVKEGNGIHLPVYLASPETQSRFHVKGGDPPLHVVIDAGGRVIAMARQNGQQTIDRLAEQVRRRLEELDPNGEMKFAFGRSRSN